MWVWYHNDDLEMFITIVKCFYFIRSYMFLIEFLETVATETANMQKVCTDMTSGEALPLLSQKSPFTPAIYWLEIHTNKWTHKTPMYLMDERIRLTTIGSPIFFLGSPLHVNLVLMLVFYLTSVDFDWKIYYQVHCYLSSHDQYWEHHHHFHHIVHFLYK